jgi:hypothetical protein
MSLMIELRFNKRLNKKTISLKFQGYIMRLFVIVLSKEDKIKREREIVRKMRSKE